MQVSWLGYPHSAGLAEIDHILVDPYLKPPDPGLLIETAVPDAGELGLPRPARLQRRARSNPALPEERTGQLTFGTMNNPYKFTAATIELWAQVMAKVPDSRFLLVRPEGGAAAFRNNIGDIFEKHGVAATASPSRRCAACICSITTASTSRSTPCPIPAAPPPARALWMGVPTVTLIGPAFFERLSYSNLTNAGLGDLCARPGTSMSRSPSSLPPTGAAPTLRRELRDQIRASPLGQTQRWVTALRTRRPKRSTPKASAS